MLNWRNVELVEHSIDHGFRRFRCFLLRKFISFPDSADPCMCVHMYIILIKTNLVKLI